MKTVLILLGFLAAMPAWAGFSQTRQSIRLEYGQKEVQVVFEATDSIKHAKPLCECTTVHIEGNKLYAKVDTSGFSKDIDKQIEVTTEDGSSAKLTMHFAVPQAVKLSARSLIWKKGREAGSKTLHISIPKGSPVHKITEASISGNDFDYTPRVVKEGAEYCVDVTPRSTEKKSLNRLIIKTDSTDPRYEGFIVYLSIQP